ncbi:hypothetical protein VTN49DRAFT_5159 [Thermomyces lanuginosus]|uniref:uncharacterized protein n=1 Tax=Thermomyces lanuginosus TaxID=5541 RepID=UPI00374211B9
MVHGKHASRRDRQSPPPGSARGRQRRTQRTDQPTTGDGHGMSTTLHHQHSHSRVTSGLSTGQSCAESSLLTDSSAMTSATTLVAGQIKPQNFINPAELVQTNGNAAGPVVDPRPTLPPITDLIPELAYLDLRAPPRLPFSHIQSTSTQQLVIRDLAGSNRVQVPTSALAEPVHLYGVPAGLA